MKTKGKVKKVESNLSRVPEKSNKIFTRHVGDLHVILSFCCSKRKLLAIASGRVVICNPDISQRLFFEAPVAQCYLQCSNHSIIIVAHLS